MKIRMSYKNIKIFIVILLHSLSTLIVDLSENFNLTEQLIIKVILNIISG